MSGEEDEKEYELKDLVIQTLEANGILPKTKAQIRANVFMALDQSDKKMNNSHENIAAKQVLCDNEGRLAAALVRDFLEKTKLEYTLSVFDPELNSKTALDDRQKLLSHFQISDNESAESPILIDLIKRLLSSSTST